MKAYFNLSSKAKLSDGLWRVEIVRCGKWDYPRVGDGGFEISPDTIRELHDNFKAGIMGREIPLNVDHDDEKECGWVKDVEIGNGGRSLYGLFEVTDPEILADVENGTLKFSSAELDFERQCPELAANGDTTPRKVLEGLALTNHPYIKRMDPVSPAIMLSDRATLNAAGVHFPSVMDEEETPGTSVGGAAADETNGGKMPEITLTELQSENASLKARLAELEENKDAKAALAESKRLRAEIDLRDTEDRVRNLVRKGKVSPALATRVLRFAELVIKGDARTITLSDSIAAKGRKYKLAEGDEEGIDKLDVIGEVVDMLGQLPDAVAMDPSGSNGLELEDDPTEDKDSEDALIAEADKVQASEPKLSRREAFAKARKNLAERKGGTK